MKKTFLFVSGHYAALDFSKKYDVQEFYEMMVSENETFKIIDTNDLYAKVKIVEFQCVSDDFLYFVRNQLIDYEKSKYDDIFEVKHS